MHWGFKDISEGPQTRPFYGSDESTPEAGQNLEFGSRPYEPKILLVLGARLCSVGIKWL